MKTQFVQITKSGVKAFYSAAKAMRKEAAEFYRDNPSVLLGEVAKQFNLSMNSLRKGLVENGIEVNRDRRFGRPIKRLLCRDCGERVHHVCGNRGKQAKASVEQAKRSEYTDPRRIHPISGKIMERTPDFIAYMESNPLPSPVDEDGNEVDYFPDDTPEQRELAALGFDGLMQRARRELGLE